MKSREPVVFAAGLELRGRCARFARNRVRVRFEQHEAEAGDHRRTCRVEKALEKVQAEHVGDREAFFARQQEWPDRFAGATKQENRGEACQRQAVDRPEIRWAEVGLKYLPTRGAEAVADVNSDEREQEIVRVGVAGDAPELRAAEAGQIDKSARPVNHKSQDGDSDDN